MSRRVTVKVEPISHFPKFKLRVTWHHFIFMTVAGLQRALPSTTLNKSNDIKLISEIQFTTLGFIRQLISIFRKDKVRIGMRKFFLSAVHSA